MMMALGIVAQQLERFEKPADLLEESLLKDLILQRLHLINVLIIVKPIQGISSLPLSLSTKQ